MLRVHNVLTLMNVQHVKQIVDRSKRVKISPEVMCAYAQLDLCQRAIETVRILTNVNFIKIDVHAHRTLIVSIGELN